MIIAGEKDDAHLGFYRMAMPQRRAVSRGVVFKMVHRKIRLTMNDFELYMPDLINIQGILNAQITGNIIIGTSAGISIDVGGVSP